MGQIICACCGKAAVYGSGVSARCSTCLPDGMKGTDYVDYHTPIFKEEDNED